MDRKLTILYGSQTGCAQDLAEHIWRESKKYHFTGCITSMDNYNVKDLLSDAAVVFVCSTTGQGEEPDNMKSFWKFLLRKNLPTDSLSRIHFAVLGLGDSSYSQFNFAAKRLNKRLKQLGAREIVQIGLCDDQHDLGTSAVSGPWIEGLWQSLLQLMPLPSNLNILAESPRTFRWNIRTETSNEISDEKCDLNQTNFDAAFNPTTFSATVLNNTRTTTDDHFQDVRMISCAAESLFWNPGDIFVVRPQNCDEQIADLFDLFAEHNFDFNERTVIRIEEIDSEMPVPSHLQMPLTLKVLAKQFWDLSAIPRPRVFELLKINCQNELEREKLSEFASPQGQEELYAYANRPRRTVLEVLRDFPFSTSQLTLPILFEIFQSIKTRSFSIASCPESKQLDIMVAVVQYKTILAKQRQGLCSVWLKSLRVGDSIRGVIKKGTFKFPTDESKPIVMVGPGTGLAPFRSLLMQRFIKWNAEKSEMYKQTLFFGCRNSEKDFHCKNELMEMVDVGMLKLITAFSRDQENKVYVQHRIEEYADHLRNELVALNGHFFVAGNSKNMPGAVKEAVVKVLGDADFVETMIKTGRYQQETWS